MKPIVLVILDGLGMRKENHGNAVKQANMPVFNYLWKTYPRSFLTASGEAVGLPADQVGNSEVGHINIGAGRVVEQPLQIINETLKSQQISNNQDFISVCEHVKSHNSKLHILGLLSDGGVHSHINQILGLIDSVKKQGISKLYIHPFLDGRDTRPKIAVTFLKQLEAKLKKTKIGNIATISGRYYAMDRDRKWERTKRVYDALIWGKGESALTTKEVIASNYNRGIYDEFVIPAILDNNGLIEDNDGLIMANFRTDRSAQLLKAINGEEFTSFKTKKLKNLKIISLMTINQLPNIKAIFKPTKLKNKFGEYIANLGYKQLRIAETEKYAHVTYFFDGLEKLKLKGCEQILIKSPLVDTYDLKPEMSAKEITKELLNQLNQNKYDVIIVNYANPDMVGHTGNLKATILALETVDKCLERIYHKIKESNGLLIVTADHGNAECLLDSHNQVITAHTNNKVPFIICNTKFKVRNGKLGDIAPTILSIMKEPIPKEMTGQNLIIDVKK